MNVTYDVFHHIYWDYRIAFDLFFGGMGVGAFLFAVFVSYYYKDTHKEVTKVGAYVSPICIIIGFFFLLAEMGNPLRIWRIYFNFNPESPLWWGAWFQGAFILISLYYAYLWYKDIEHNRKLVGYIGSVVAVIVGGFHGFLLTVVKSKPIWYGGESIITNIASFILTGVAVVILILSLRSDAKFVLKSIKLARDILAVAIVVQMIVLYLWVIKMFYGPFFVDRAIHHFNTDFGFLFWGGVVIFGLLIPLVMGGIAIYREKKLREHPFSVTIPAITSALVLVGAFILKYVWVIGGQLFN